MFPTIGSARKRKLNYRQISKTRRTNPKTKMFLVLSCSCLCPIHWSHLLSRKWRCSWSSADRRCSNCIRVMNNFIAYWDATYIRGLTVSNQPLVFSEYHCFGSISSTEVDGAGTAVIIADSATISLTTTKVYFMASEKLKPSVFW